ncbi:MAG: hypothetical protein ACYDCO_15980 [Armatimonadota bacterium]
MPFTREFRRDVASPAVCGIMVVVDDAGHCEVETKLREYQRTHPREFKKIVLVINKLAEKGHQAIYDTSLCRKLHGRAGEGLYEFRDPGGLLRVIWFFIPSSDGGSSAAILLVSASRPNKGAEQDREIERAQTMRQRFLVNPFPGRSA